MTEYCDIVDCNGLAVVYVGKDNKHVCIVHAQFYQQDLSDRIKRTGLRYYDRP